MKKKNKTEFRMIIVDGVTYVRVEDVLKMLDRLRGTPVEKEGKHEDDKR